MVVRGLGARSRAPHDRDDRDGDAARAQRSALEIRVPELAGSAGNAAGGLR